jgi:hypothetical protein
VGGDQRGGSRLITRSPSWAGQAGRAFTVYSVAGRMKRTTWVLCQERLGASMCKWAPDVALLGAGLIRVSWRGARRLTDHYLQELSCSLGLWEFMRRPVNNIMQCKRARYHVQEQLSNWL